MGPFLDAHASLPISTAERALGSGLHSSYVLPKAGVEAAIHQLEKYLQMRNDILRELLIVDPHIPAHDVQSPLKRRAVDEDTDDRRVLVISCIFERTLINSCPYSPPQRNKRAKSWSALSIDQTTTDLDGSSSSPPPSTSLSSADVTEKPLITAAMLRALTQDILKTYGRDQR